MKATLLGVAVISTGAIWEVGSLGFASEFVVVGFFLYSIY